MIVIMVIVVITRGVAVIAVKINVKKEGGDGGGVGRGAGDLEERVLNKGEMRTGIREGRGREGRYTAYPLLPPPPPHSSKARIAAHVGYGEEVGQEGRVIEKGERGVLTSTRGSGEDGE